VGSSDVDYGSTVFVVIFLQEIVLGVLLFVPWSTAAALSPKPPAAQWDDTEHAATETTDPDEALDRDSAFLYDVVARENERIVQSIDALDTTLIAVVVGIVAVALFAGDKFSELQPNDRCAGFILLAEAAAAALLGYFSAPTFLLGENTAEFGPILEFVSDFSSLPLTTTLSAIGDLIAAATLNRSIRLAKRRWILLATAYFFVATVCLIIARAHGGH